MAPKGIQKQARRGARRPWIAAAAVVSWLVYAGGPALAGEPDEAAREAALQGQVRVLSEALAAARAENDVLRARLDREDFDAAGGSVEDVVPGSRRSGDEDCRILDINKGLGMAILSAGRRQGIRPGMVFAVMQGDRSVATLRVVDARMAIAGAVIEKASPWRYPRAQDRAIRVAGSRE